MTNHHLPQLRDAQKRRQSVSNLQDRPSAQVLIIGGGVNGVGTFRDLALQGIDVALVERGDYCQGASGASSHMIHGGIRYLENGEFRLVKESVTERNALLDLAPHYVKPLKTTIPIFSTFSGILAAPLRFLTHKQQGRPKERGAFLIKVGLSLYDAFSRDGGSVPRHEFKGREKALRELPRLNSGIKYTATYFDASVHNPERMTLDLLQDGERTNENARSGNYVKVSGIRQDGIELTDELTGESFTFAADVIVNTTGAWVDLTNQSLGAPTSFMGGTKGSHIVLDHPELLNACNGREIFFEHTDGRIVLIYPMDDRVLVGTTDIRLDISEDAICTGEEIAYFFELVSHVFPDIALTQEQIVYSFSGIRPLPRQDSEHTGFISRDYRIERDTREIAGKQVPVLSLVGGKWTTFRALSEHMTNDVLAILQRPRMASTARLPIGGGKDYPRTEDAVQSWITSRVSGKFDAFRVRDLLERYGTRADEVMAFLAAGEDHPLHCTAELSSRELEFMVRNEQVGHLVDVLIRRTSLAFRGLVTVELLDEITQHLSILLGWDHTRALWEIQHTGDTLLRFHRVTVAAQANSSTGPRPK